MQVEKLAGNQGLRALTRLNRDAKMIGLRALSGARVYRREPVSSEVLGSAEGRGSLTTEM